MKQLKYFFLITVCLISCKCMLNAQQQLLSLSDAIQTGLTNSYGVVIAGFDVDIASINNNWGTAGRFPGIGFTAASLNSVDIEEGENTSFNTVRANLNATWTIFDGFRVNITK